jgi:ABC-type bacteriocin/lantibiotic exporter with double-glycine peptidase domain
MFKFITRNKIVFFLLSYAKKHTKLIIIGSVLLVITTLLAIPVPLLTKQLIDDVIYRGSIERLLFILGLISLVLVVNYSVNFIQGMIFVKINNLIVMNIRVDILKKLSVVRERRRENYQVGYLIQRINNDTSQLGSLMADTLVHIVQDILILLTGIILLLVLHWKMALVSFMFLPIYFYTIAVFTKKIQNVSLLVYEKGAQAAGQLKESLEMIPLYKLYTNHSYNMGKYSAKIESSVKEQIRLGIISFLNSNISGFVSRYAPIVVLGVGCYEIINNRLTMGGLIAFTAYLGYLFNPTNRLVNVNITIQKSLVALRRILALFDLPEERSGTYKLDSGEIQQIDLKNIRFTYGRERIFDKFSFQVKKGDIIGISGPSGAGKTTLLKLITRMYTPLAGKIEINEINCEDFDIESFRNRIGVVEQEPLIIEDSIKNNISLGDLSYRDEDIAEAARKAYIHNFIISLEDGYNTLIKEGGTNLSVGQKQRIAIARMVLRNPDILIFDEPTSNLDLESEQKIYRMISELSRQNIIFLITHKKKYLEMCTKVVELTEAIKE